MMSKEKLRIELPPEDREPKKRKSMRWVYEWVSMRSNFREVSRPRPRSAKK